ncbi:hypothetical protein GCM10011316_35090 [Roseibium aquae]|uniref:Flagellar hook-length control protein-like C-terminal domain-containing protein n=1 Tax=Roseibium aquae TaxID=1323746 RepID=A0A916X337_9HYPH|nr:flagellar hook-length control protein FliK [Roseibium aquae]GGB60046.1 hypothetical protein GCM10011316_35090 [Roseibium aquae]
MSTGIQGSMQTAKLAETKLGRGSSEAASGEGAKDAAKQFTDLLGNLSGRGKGAVDGQARDGGGADGRAAREPGSAARPDPREGPAVRDSKEDAARAEGQDAAAANPARFGIETLSGALNIVSKVVEGSRTAGSPEMPVLQHRAGQQKLQSYLSSGLALTQVTSGPKTANGSVAAPQGGLGNGQQGTSSLFAQFGTEPQRIGDPLLNDARKLDTFARIEPGSLKVLKQETHFAPSMRLSPVQQVGQSLVGALNEVAAGLRTGTSAFARPEGPVLKTLEIQLTPIELGTVKVTLKMVDNAVAVTLKASNPQTAELLKQDRGLLDQMLRVTGHKAETITIQTAADDRPLFAPQASGNAGQSQSAPNQGAGTQPGHPGFDQAGSGGGQDRHDRQHDDRFGVDEGLVPDDRNPSETKQAASGSHVDGIYL